MVSVSRLSRRRQAAGLHALPRPRKRYLRTRAAFGVRLLAGAVEEQHCARRPTAPPVPSKPVPPPHLIPYSPEDIAQSRARFHPGPMERIRWRARFRPGQGTPWKPSLPLDERRVPVRFVPAPHSLAWPVSPQPKSHSGGKPPQSMRCRDPKRRLRTRAAFGVRLLAGAFRQRHCARAAPAPALLPTTDRILGGREGTRCGPGSPRRPKPQPRLRLARNPRRRTVWKPSLQRANPVPVVPSAARRSTLDGRVPPRPCSHSAGKLAYSMRCRNPHGASRTREARGVRPPAALRLAHAGRLVGTVWAQGETKS